MLVQPEPLPSAWHCTALVEPMDAALPARPAKAPGNSRAYNNFPRGCGGPASRQSPLLRLAPAADMTDLNPLLSRIEAAPASVPARWWKRLLSPAPAVAMAAGSAPAQPGGPFAYRGLYGKLWRAKAT